jgi:transglutaminase-like putative cysteine protease
MWMAGQEVGGREATRMESGTREGIQTREWIRLERLGMVVEQRVSQTAFRDADGSLEFTWSIHLAQEPMEGRALWRPGDPTRLFIHSKNLPERVIALEAGTVLWPLAQDARLREAARTRSSLHIKGYMPALQQTTELDLKVIGAEPLPGFPDAVRFKGRSREGAMQTDTELWVSPTAGEVKDSSNLAGIPLLVQRVELPTPAGVKPTMGFFERTLKTLPPHPFLPWLSQATLRWEGPGDQLLPEDAQQKRLGPGRIHLTRAAQPNRQEATEPPVQGPPAAQDAPFLAPSPLLQFQDPAFEGLLTRLRAPVGASRWELAQRVNRFVFDWITEKDYTVGFASALEVAHRPKGDCTEHGVLAVALLRKLGVPSRGALGWIGAGGVLGLHFWVEVELQGRWVPIDPTFDEAPASALHLKLGTTDLADLGSVGWDTVATRFIGGTWAPEGAWAEGIRIRGERVFLPDGAGLRLPNAGWKLAQGVLSLIWRGTHPVEAVPHPSAVQLNASKAFQSPRNGRRGWWQGLTKTLWVQLDAARWVRVSELDERAAVDLLDQLEPLPLT